MKKENINHNYIITTSIHDDVLNAVINSEECGRVKASLTSGNVKLFTVRTSERWANLIAILAGNGDFNSTIVRLGSISGEPLFVPREVKSLNRF